MKNVFIKSNKENYTNDENVFMCGKQNTFKRLNNELRMNSLNTLRNNYCYSILWKLRDF